MIPYVEILKKDTRLTTYIIEPVEVWFEQSYYSVGEFEVYARATEEALAALVEGNYIKIPNDNSAWIIESIEYSFTTDKGRMISAKGREVKAILEKRIIANTTTINTDLATAVNNLVLKNAGANAESARKIIGLEVAASAVSETIQQAQVSYDNLLEYTDTLLQAHDCGARMTIEDARFKYQVYKGSNKSGSVIFSQSYDNLLNSTYNKDVKNVKTFAYVGGTGEGLDRVFNNYAVNNNTGIDRAEVFIDAKDIAAKYQDENGQDQELDLTKAADLATYKGWLTERGKEKLADYIKSEVFTGEIDTNNNMYVYGVDYSIGDIVRIQDEYFNLHKDTRIIKRTVSQDVSGYRESINYEE